MGNNGTTPLFSIITVCMNDKEGLIRTRNSIQSQINKNFEWLVIDGASKDGTKELLEQLPSTVCKWLSEPDKGLYDAMNKGIERATGQYLLFLNSGDEFASSDVLNYVREQVVSGDYPDFLYGDSQERSKSQELAYKPARSHKHLWYGMFTHHQAMFYRRESLGLVRYSNLYPIGADYALTAELLKRSRRVRYIPYAICIFEHGGLSSNNIKRGEEDQLMIRRTVMKYPYAVCIIIKSIHAAIRGLKRLLPSMHHALRYTK